MLGDTDPVVTLSVKDLGRAKKFYEGTLGLNQIEDMEPEAVVYRSGSGKVMVYRSQFAGTNKATAASWTVDDVNATVRALKAKGVTFEHYDLPGMKLEGDVYVADGMRTAWFKDPDGNILNVVNM